MSAPHGDAEAANQTGKAECIHQLDTDPPESFEVNRTETDTCTECEIVIPRKALVHLPLLNSIFEESSAAEVSGDEDSTMRGAYRIDLRCMPHVVA